MTAEEKRLLVVDQAGPAIGRNRYSQNGVKRECVFTPHTDGRYYSDCSSFVRWLYRRAGLIKNIGSNTVSIINNKDGVEVACAIKNGAPTNIGALRVGDVFLFRGNDASRAASRYVGHVEIVAAIKGSTVTLMGHGSGHPKKHGMVAYCRARWLWPVANSRIKNRGLICVKRFIPDDATPEPAPVDPARQVKVLGNRVNVRSGPGTGYAIRGVIGKGTLLPLSGDATVAWTGVMYKGSKAFVYSKYLGVV